MIVPHDDSAIVGANRRAGYRTEEGYPAIEVAPSSVKVSRQPSSDWWPEPRSASVPSPVMPTHDAWERTRYLGARVPITFAEYPLHAVLRGVRIQRRSAVRPRDSHDLDIVAVLVVDTVERLKLSATGRSPRGEEVEEYRSTGGERFRCVDGAVRKREDDLRGAAADGIAYRDVGAPAGPGRGLGRRGGRRLHRLRRRSGSGRRRGRRSCRRLPAPAGGERQRKERDGSGAQEDRANSNSKHRPAMIPQCFRVGRDVQRESSPYPAVETSLNASRTLVPESEP